MKKYIILFIFLGLIAVAFFVTLTYFQMGKPLKNLFDRADNIIENQILIDSTFTLLNLNTFEENKVDLNNDIILSFRHIKNLNLIEEKKITDKLKQQNKIFYIIINDTLGIKRNIESSLPLYFADTINFPLKEKKLLYPYTVVIKNKKIKRIILGDFNKLFEDE